MATCAGVGIDIQIPIAALITRSDPISLEGFVLDDVLKPFSGCLFTSVDCSFHHILLFPAW